LYKGLNEPKADLDAVEKKKNIVTGWIRIPAGQPIARCYAD
jgi:hypothetical protein